MTVLSDRDAASLVETMMTNGDRNEVRAVITGVGAVTPLGVGADVLIDSWVAGECGLENGLGSCEAFDPDEFLSTKEQRRGDRFTHLAVAAGAEAVAQAGWSELPYAAERVGCIFGTGIGGVATIYDAHETMRDGGASKVSPMLIPNMMPNAAAASLAIRYGFAGEVFGVVSACAAGAHAVGAGLRLLSAGVADAVVVGGSEAANSPVTMAGLKTMGAISECGISRPFDRDRDGFVLGEGAGALVLEAPAAAERRGAKALGEIIGYGATCDAFHLTAPSSDGEAAARAIAIALISADVGPDDIDYINAHGTSTPLNDATETASIKTALGRHAYTTPISSTKSVVGHQLGAAGAVDCVATLAALRARVAPPTVGLANPDEGLDLNYVQDEPQALAAASVKPQLIGVTNSFGFGGHNAVIVIRA
jgi:3-oxoacyl-[acyl-carrier-protein] synthase II